MSILDLWQVDLCNVNLVCLLICWKVGFGKVDCWSFEFVGGDLTVGASNLSDGDLNVGALNLSEEI